MKKLFAGVAALIVLAAVGAGIWVYSSLDALVKTAIETYGPEITAVPVKVAAVKLAPADGEGALDGLVIANPKGFRTAHALSAGRIELGVDIASVAKDVIVIRKIIVIAPQITYESGDGVSNIDVIQRNVEKFAGAKPRDKKEPGKKLIVERLLIKDARASYAGALTAGKAVGVPLPDIELRDIGKAKGGVTADELAKTIIDALKQRLTKALGIDAVKRGAGAVVDSVKGLFGK
jgi:hypothetical protein